MLQMLDLAGGCAGLNRRLPSPDCTVSFVDSQFCRSLLSWVGPESELGWSPCRNHRSVSVCSRPDSMLTGRRWRRESSNQISIHLFVDECEMTCAPGGQSVEQSKACVRTTREGGPQGCRRFCEIPRTRIQGFIFSARESILWHICDYSGNPLLSGK